MVMILASEEMYLRMLGASLNLPVTSLSFFSVTIHIPLKLPTVAVIERGSMT